MGPAERRAFIALRTKVYTKRSNLAQNSACCFRFRVVQASQAAEEVLPPFCHSERSEESLFLFLNLIRKEIPRFAQNDKINYSFRSLLSLWFLIAAILTVHSQ